ncbi:MAG: nucleotide exchange factor GrpE [bacterium]|nr:nucleotide exchange factor GrpE [bacterium]
MPEEMEELEDEPEVVEEEGLGEKIKKLRAELKSCKLEKAEYLAGWQRAKADFINARKNEERARAEFLKYAEERALYDILAVADSLELALKMMEGLPADSASVATSAKETASAKAGMEQIYSQLRAFLKSHGVMPIESAGEKFNPIEHEALENEEVTEEAQDNIVLEELQKGWRLYDRVLRPAKVKVGVLKK